MSTENVRALSVRDLVRQRCGHETDVWHLALVQRDEVWDQVRMRYLLDSLLNRYPIGSRGALLDGRQIEELAGRVEELLAAHPSAAGAVTDEQGSSV